MTGAAKRQMSRTLLTSQARGIGWQPALGTGASLLQLQCSEPCQDWPAGSLGALQKFSNPSPPPSEHYLGQPSKAHREPSDSGNTVKSSEVWPQSWGHQEQRRRGMQLSKGRPVEKGVWRAARSV